MQAQTHLRTNPGKCVRTHMRTWVHTVRYMRTSAEVYTGPYVHTYAHPSYAHVHKHTITRTAPHNGQACLRLTLHRRGNGMLIRKVGSSHNPNGGCAARIVRQRPESSITRHSWLPGGFDPEQHGTSDFRPEIHHPTCITKRWVCANPVCSVCAAHYH